MVHGDTVQRIKCAVWELCEGGRRRVAGTGHTVRRLCGMAEEVDGGRGAAAAGGVLEEEPGRSAGVAGSAGGPCASGAAGLLRGQAAGGVERRSDGGAERAECAAGDNAIYDAAGGVGGVVGEIVGGAGRGDWDAGGQ